MKRYVNIIFKFVLVLSLAAATCTMLCACERDENAVNSTTQFHEADNSVSSIPKESSTMKETSEISETTLKTNYVFGYGFDEDLGISSLVTGSYYGVEGDQGISFVISKVIKTGNAEKYDYSLHENGFAEITKCYSSEPEIVIPQTIAGYPVAYIGNEVFSSSNIKSIELPNGILAIGERAFAESKNLENIKFPDSLIAVSYEAFADCESLKNIEFGKGLKVIGEGGFKNCSEITELRFPDSLSVISIGSFGNCNKLRTVVFNSEISRIASGAFENTAIEEIVIPDGVDEIGAAAFRDCINLKRAVLPEKLGYEYNGFGGGCFSGCTSLEEINIPKNVRGIFDGTFEDCESLESIVIPASVEMMGIAVFNRCKNLKDIYFESKDCGIYYNSFLFTTGLTVHAPKGGSVEEFFRLRPLVKFVATD